MTRLSLLKPKIEELVLKDRKDFADHKLLHVALVKASRSHKKMLKKKYCIQSGKMQSGYRSFP